MTNVIDKINSVCLLSDNTIQVLKESVTLCRFPKKHLLIKENTFCKFAYFIEKGMTRSFWLVNGEEITTSFSCEGGIVFSMDELYYNKLSEEFVETLEDVVAYKISTTTALNTSFTSDMGFSSEIRWGATYAVRRPPSSRRQRPSSLMR